MISSRRPGPRHSARSISLILALAASALVATAAPGTSQLQFFRSNLGLSSPGSRPLPVQLSDPQLLRWRVSVDPGHSTPIVCSDRILLTTYRAESKELATVALSRIDGRELWRRVASAPAIEAFHSANGSAAQATPASDGSRVFVFFGSCGVLCYDLEGQLLWEHRMGPFQDEFGSGSSPVLVGDLVIIQQDHDLDSVLLGLDSRTGAVRWKKPRPDAVRSYSTPSVWLRNGRKELLVAGALELAAHDPANGERLWSIRGLARIVIPAPVPSGDRVFMASWSPGGDAGRRISLEPWAAAIEKWDRNHDGRLSRGEIDNGDVLERFFRMDTDRSGDLNQSEWERYAEVFQRAQNALLAIKPGDGKGELRDESVAWKHPRGVPYVATPVCDEHSVWMVKDGGIVTRLAAADGKVLFEERLPGSGNYFASPIICGEHAMFASESGVVSIVSTGPEWRVVASRDFREKIHATPVVEDGDLLLRTERALYWFGDRR